jgi:hypothetical protein
VIRRCPSKNCPLECKARLNTVAVRFHFRKCYRKTFN